MVQQRQYRNATGFIGPTTSKPNIIVPSSYGQSAYSFGGGSASPQTGSGQSDPLWLQALDFISRPQRAITGMLAESTSDGSSFLSTLDAAWKGLSGQEKRDFDEFLTNLGWEDEEGFGWHDVASFAGDVALDPLTYLTFGAGSVAKIGSRAGAEALKDAAKQAGVRVSRQGMQDFSGRGVREIYNAAYDNLIRQGVSPEVARRQAEQIFESAKLSVQNAAAAARGVAQNNLFNIDIPFTNIAKGIGRKPEFLTKVDPKIGSVGASAASDIFRQMGYAENEQAQILRNIYGVDRLEDLGLQQFDHLLRQRQRFDDFLRQSEDVASQPNIYREGIENLFSGPIPSTARSVSDELVSAARPGVLPSLSGAGTVPRISLGDAIISGSPSARRAETRNIVDAEIIDNVLSKFKFDEFVQDAGGRSRFGDMLGKFTDYFNPRTLKIEGEGLLNRAASHIRDSHARIAGQAQKMRREIEEIEKLAEGLSEDQLKAIPYILEGKFPESGFRPEDVTDQMRQVADRMKGIYDDLAKLELDAGILENVRAGYFPHILKLSDNELRERAKKYMNDPEFAQFIRLSSDNNFSKQRRRFQTIAQIDNYIAAMQRSLADESLSSLAKAELEEKISILSQMFERNPIDALAKRYYVSIQSRAMRDLKDQLLSEGLIRTADDFSSSPNAARVANQYTRLTSQQARRLGLSEGDYVHNDIMNALKRMESIFSEKNMAKLVGHFESVHNIWKMLVTTLVPRHYLNNFIGNVFNNYLAGVRSLRSYSQATELILAMRRGKLTKEQENLLQEAAERGVLSSGFTSDFTRAGILDPNSRLAKAEQAVRDWGGTQWMRRNLGDSIDHVARLAHYIDVKRKTGSATKAAESVRKYLFNYNEMTTADRYARMFIPFWNWTKNNIPLQLEQIMQQPRFYQTYERLRSQFNEDVQDQIPSWAADEYVHVGGGNLWNPYVPVYDLNDGLARTFTNSITPFAKFPMELATNQNFFTGRPIEYGVNPYEGDWYSAGALGQYLVNTFGGGVARRASDILSGDTDVFEFLRNITFGKPVNVNE